MEKSAGKMLSLQRQKDPWIDAITSPNLTSSRPQSLQQSSTLITDDALHDYTCLRRMTWGHPTSTNTLRTSDLTVSFLSSSGLSSSAIIRRRRVDRLRRSPNGQGIPLRLGSFGAVRAPLQTLVGGMISSAVSDLYKQKLYVQNIVWSHFWLLLRTNLRFLWF